MPSVKKSTSSSAAKHHATSPHLRGHLGHSTLLIYSNTTLAIS